MAGQLQGVTILVVEDEPIIALDVQAILEREGARVIVESTRQGAKARIASAPAYDAVLLDFVLGDSTGHDLAGQFLSAGTPFVFLTASVQFLPKDYAAVPCVEKPFAPVTLIDAVKAAVRR